MSRFELLQLSETDSARRHQVGLKGLFIGRSDEADIVIKQDSVSRLHVKFWSQGDALEMEYLGSRDGIKVNGQRQISGQLRDGDSIEVGEEIFVVTDTELPESQRKVPRSGNGTPGNIDPTLRSSKRSPRGVPKSEIVLEASQNLNCLIFNLDELLKQTLTYALDWIPAQRAFILERSPTGTKAPVRSSRSLTGTDDGPPINEDVVQFVQEKRSAMIKSQQARAQAAADPGNVAAGAMCAPLIGHNGCIGTIYIDSAWEPSPFDTGDLDDLKSLGRIAGLALDNALKCRELAQQGPEGLVQDLAYIFAENARKTVSSVDAAVFKIERELDAGKLKQVQALWPLLGRTINNAELLVESMLSYARVRPLEPGNIDLNELVDKAVTAVRPRAHRLDITIEYHPDDAVGAYADGREVYLIVLNLLATAIDAYERDKGTILLRTASETGAGAVEIEYYARPISPERAAELSRGILSRDGEDDLRLVAAFKAAEEMGGNIRVRNETDPSTIFTLLLPGLRVGQ